MKDKSLSRDETRGINATTPNGIATMKAFVHIADGKWGKNHLGTLARGEGIEKTSQEDVLWTHKAVPDCNFPPTDHLHACHWPQAVLLETPITVHRNSIIKQWGLAIQQPFPALTQKPEHFESPVNP